jgi:hypothetical protein
MSTTGLPEIKVRLVKGASNMAGLFSRCAFSNQGYTFQCDRKCPTKHKRVFELTDVHEMELVMALRYTNPTTLFRVSRITWEDDPETCWRVEWETHGMLYRIQFFYKKFIDMEVEDNV